MATAYFLARTGGTTQVLTLVLAGVVTAAFFTALVSLLTYLADPQDALPAIVYWLMGSFALTTYGALGLFAVVLAASGLPPAPLRSRLYRSEGRHVGKEGVSPCRSMCRPYH